MLFSHDREGNFALWDNMDGPWGHYAKWDKSDIKTVGPHLCVESKTELMEAVDWWLPRPESWGRWGNAGQKAQTSSYKVNKCWGSKAQDGGCS